MHLQFTHQIKPYNNCTILYLCKYFYGALSTWLPRLNYYTPLSVFPVPVFNLAGPLTETQFSHFWKLLKMFRHEIFAESNYTLYQFIAPNNCQLSCQLLQLYWLGEAPFSHLQKFLRIMAVGLFEVPINVMYQFYVDPAGVNFDTIMKLKYI